RQPCASRETTRDTVTIKFDFDGTALATKNAGSGMKLHDSDVLKKARLLFRQEQVVSIQCVHDALDLGAETAAEVTLQLLSETEFRESGYLIRRQAIVVKPAVEFAEGPCVGGGSF